MSLSFRPHIATLPAYRPPTVPRGVERVVDMSTNENPLGPSPKAVAALGKALWTVNRYPDAPGTALKTALAEKWGLSPANGALISGTDEWMLLCLSLVGPGDEELVG
jgi:histidinol-phosphate aminotransferase